MCDGTPTRGPVRENCCRDAELAFFTCIQYSDTCITSNSIHQQAVIGRLSRVAMLQSVEVLMDPSELVQSYHRHHLMQGSALHRRE